MISLISLSLFLLLSSLFYFVFVVINFSNLYFWIIKISVPLSKIMEEIFSDLFPLFKQGGQKKKQVKSMRQVLLKYIYICIKYLMYKIIFWQLKLVSTVSVFAIKMTFKKLSKMLFIVPKKLLLSSRFSNFCTSLFLSFFLPWPLLIL